MYIKLFSLYVCVSVFLWPLGVCVEWDVTGRLPCSTHKSNSTFFSSLGLTWCPRLPTLHTPAQPQNCVCVWYTQALVLDRPYMPPSNPACTHIYSPQGEGRLDKNWSTLPNRTDRKETWDYVDSSVCLSYIPSVSICKSVHPVGHFFCEVKCLVYSHTYTPTSMSVFPKAYTSTQGK